MMFNVSTKALTLLLAIGVASTNGSNLRQRTTLVNNGYPLDRQEDAASTTVAKNGNLRSRPASASASSASDDVATAEQQQQQPEEPAPSISADKSVYSEFEADSGLMTYRKGTNKATERQHAAVSKASVEGIVKKNAANSKISSANGLEVNMALMEEGPAAEAEEGASVEEDASPSKGSIRSEKEEYDHDEAVSVHYALHDGADPSKYRIGIYMRMAHPQGGELPPVVSLPLCSGGPCRSDQGVAYSGSATFSSETMDLMEPEGAQWPMDLYQWGTGYDAYILDESGHAVMGPVKFNIMMSS